MAQYHDAYFFLYPPGPVAARAVRLLAGRRLPRQTSSSAPMPADRLHITLQCLGRYEGRIPQEIRDLAMAVGRAVDDAPFNVAFDRLQSHDRPGAVGTLALVGHGLGVRKLRAFQCGLGETMRRMGFAESQIRKSFNPHMTLDYAHERVTRQTVAPIAWRAAQLFLVDSHFHHGKHEVLASWQLKERQQEFSGWEPAFSR